METSGKKNKESTSKTNTNGQLTGTDQSDGIDLTIGGTKRVLGIDYGSKRIGVAVSDELGTMAFPCEVFKNTGNRQSAEYISTLCNVRFEGIELIVIGESKNYKGEDNAIMEDTREFAEHLKSMAFDVVFEPEVLSTMEAERIQGKREDIDSSAAAVILQSFLNRRLHTTPQKTLEQIHDSKYEL